MRGILGLLLVSMLCANSFVEASDLVSPSAQFKERTEPQDPTAVFPLRVSANRRYLVDQNDLPFFIAGDSPQNIFLALSEAEADWFMANRQAVGFNTIWINVITLFVNATTYDGIPPLYRSGRPVNPE